MRTFKVNEKEYRAKAFDFNLVCDLEDMGIAMADAQKKPMSMVRAYFAICTGNGKEYAGKEMEQHIANGGTFEEIMNVMGAEMEESDFFRNLSKNAETEDAENQGEESKKK